MKIETLGLTTITKEKNRSVPCHSEAFVVYFFIHENMHALEFRLDAVKRHWHVDIYQGPFSVKGMLHTNSFVVVDVCAVLAVFARKKTIPKQTEKMSAQWIARLSVAYFLSMPLYMLTTRILKYGTPFNDSLSAEQQKIKKESAKKRLSAFLLSMSVSVFLVFFLWKPFAQKKM